MYRRVDGDAHARHADLRTGEKGERVTKKAALLKLKLVDASSPQALDASSPQALDASSPRRARDTKMSVRLCSAPGPKSRQSPQSRRRVGGSIMRTGGAAL